MSIHTVIHFALLAQQDPDFLCFSLFYIAVNGAVAYIYKNFIQYSLFNSLITMFELVHSIYPSLVLGLFSRSLTV